MLTETWPVALGSLPESQGFSSFRLRLDRFPESFFTAHGGVWQKALALLILGPAERDEWRRTHRLPPERLRWLLERLVAKDAVRSYVRERAGIELTPADVAISSRLRGGTIVTGAFGESMPNGVAVALARAGDDVVAVVGAADRGEGLGVVLGRLGAESSETAALTSAEEQLLPVGADAGEWSLRLRAAKQAAINGLAEDDERASSVVIERLDPASQYVWLRLNGDKDRRVVYTAREGDLVVATTMPSQQRGERDE
jgi:VCBS repeat-containing protein